jgi:ribonuclease HI
MNLIAYIDGSSFGNPGESGCGIVLQSEEGTVLEQIGLYLGHATNNVAEYEGLLQCLNLARKYGAISLTVFSDSQLLVNQMNGSYRVKKAHLIELHERIKKILESAKVRFDIQYIPREKNRDADRLARNAIRSRSQTTS